MILYMVLNPDTLGYGTVVSQHGMGLLMLFGAVSFFQ